MLEELELSFLTQGGEKGAKGKYVTKKDQERQTGEFKYWIEK